MKLFRKEKKLKSTNWFVFTVLAIGSIAMLFPFVWMFLSSFKTKADVYVYPPQWLPSQWNWDNFEAVFEMIPFLRYYNVFHIDQCEGITAKHATSIQADIEPDAQAEQIIADESVILHISVKIKDSYQPSLLFIC